MWKLIGFQVVEGTFSRNGYDSMGFDGIVAVDFHLDVRNHQGEPIFLENNDPYTIQEAVDKEVSRDHTEEGDDVNMGSSEPILTKEGVEWSLDPSVSLPCALERILTKLSRKQQEAQSLVVAYPQDTTERSVDIFGVEVLFSEEEGTFRHCGDSTAWIFDVKECEEGMNLLD